MIRWQDNGYIVAVRKYGEGSAIASILTAEHGRQAGLVRGATRPAMRGQLQIGNWVDAAWQARLDTHLGYYKIELRKSWSTLFFDDPIRLAALRSAAAMTETCLPEREAYPDVHTGFAVVLEALAHLDHWAMIYAKFELGLLQVLGYGLELDRCAATGETADLCYVSPRSGRAVSRQAGAPYHAKLLPLPAFLINHSNQASTEAVLQALELTAYFFEHRLWRAHHQTEPEARHYLLQCLRRKQESGKQAKS